MRRGAALAVAATLAGCGATPVSSPTTPPVREGTEPLALLPGDVEMLVDVDAAQLRAWPLLRRFERMPALAELARSVGDSTVERSVIGVIAPGTDAAELVRLTVLGAGARATATAIGAGPSVAGAATVMATAGASYHGVAILDEPPTARARLTPRIEVSASRATVRRVIDVLHGDEPPLPVSAATDGKPASLDASLGVALGRSPSAREGRAALRGALRAGPALVARATSAGIPPSLVAPVGWVSFALAVGDGADLGVVLGTHDERSARALDEALHAELIRFQATPVLRVIGISPFLDGVRTGRAGGEVHLALRLEETRLVALLDRVDALVRLASGLPATDSTPHEPSEASP